LIGAGRTELAHTLFGMARADAGSVRLSGSSVDFASNREAHRAGIAYVSEDRLCAGSGASRNPSPITPLSDPEGNYGAERS